LKREGEFPKTKEVDVHRIITTSFNVELNQFIAKFEQKKPSFEVVRTGGLTEIRVRSNDAFAAYAYFLKDFRKELFSKSVNWSFPLDSFLSELDSLVNFYVSVFNLVENNCVRDYERDILSELLEKPLSSFFRSVDQEFGISYFDGKKETLKTESPTIVWKRESIEEKFDRMAEANRRKRIRKMREEQTRLEKLKAALSRKNKRNSFRVGYSTKTYDNIYHHYFWVPTKVYSTEGYRERLDNARTLEEVEQIIEDYNKHHRKEQEPNEDKKHWWR
jgi:hypothetical protein